MKIIAHDYYLGDREITDACKVGDLIAIKPTDKPWTFLNEKSHIDGIIVYDKDPSIFIGDDGKCVEGDAIFNSVIEAYHNYLTCK